VDDIEIEGQPGGEAYVSAILAGPGAWEERLPSTLGRLASRLFGGDVQRIPWDEVSDINVRVELKRAANELGLGGGDVQRWMEKLPDS
jgi:hypothetical protein